MSPFRCVDRPAVPALTQKADESANEDGHPADQAPSSKNGAVIECHGVWRLEGRGTERQDGVFSPGV